VESSFVEKRWTIRGEAVARIPRVEAASPSSSLRGIEISLVSRCGKMPGSRTKRAFEF